MTVSTRGTGETAIERGRVVAIHQPTFLPWLGYFDKIVRSDVFVVLDSVQFPRGAPGSWMNRVKLAISGKEQWVTVPVRRSGAGFQEVREVRIDESRPWRQKLIRTIEMNYARAAHFASIFPTIQAIFQNPTDKLAEFNLAAIAMIARAMDFNFDHVVLSSSLAVTGSGTDLLIEITRRVGGSTYMCGGGAAGYQDDDAFARNGIGLVYQKFAHPSYSAGDIGMQPPGLSIVDALMHCGTQDVRRMLIPAPRQAEE